MPLTPTETRALLARLGHRPRRSLGQNFLVDGNIVRKSLELARVGPGDTVVEVGPGLGTLTEALLEAGAAVWAVESDPALCDHLEAAIGQLYPRKLRLLKGDAVLHPLAGLEPGGAAFKIVSNLPYAIATPWLDAVLAGPLPERMVLMLQCEAAERYTARPGTKAFGSISVFLQAAYQADPGHKVAASCFYPRPEVESRLLNLARKPEPWVFPPEMKLALRGLFQHRRKQIGALLRGHPWLGRLAAAGIPPKTRPEAVPVCAWVRLAQEG